MSAMAVAIIGGPLTMGFLALETTGSLPLTTAVLAACVVSALTVRRTFGYSFATWRFHLRGEAICSAVDIGWMRNLTVGRMMRREVRTVHADKSLAEFRTEFPLGSMQRAIALNADDQYAGIIQVAEAHADLDEGHHVSDLLHCTDIVLLPQMTVKEAIAMFENAETDALAVIDGTDTRHVHRDADRALRVPAVYDGAGTAAAGAVRGVARSLLYLSPWERSERFSAPGEGLPASPIACTCRATSPAASRRPQGQTVGDAFPQGQR